MNEKSAFASLSAGLLARKGQAKPAMRPQLYKFVDDDDLGWNDMGTDMLTPEQAALVSPAPIAAAAVAPVAIVKPDTHHSVTSPAPEVVQQQEALSEAFTPAPVAVPVSASASAPAFAPAAAAIKAVPAVDGRKSVANAPKLRAAPGTKAKSAFTLRIDQERHLRLRLASAYAHRSAQNLLIEALDRFLEECFPETAQPKVAN